MNFVEEPKIKHIQEKPFNTNEGNFEIKNRNEFEQYKDVKINCITNESRQVKTDGLNRLNAVAHSYDVSEESVEEIRRDVQIESRLELISGEIDELTESAQEQIAEVGKTEKKETREFSKKYSSFRRTEVASQILQTRDEYRKKKSETETDNLEIQKKRRRGWRA